MSSELSKINLERDKRVLGDAWGKTYNSYFSDENNIQSFVSSVIPYLPNHALDILYVASAGGILGEALLKELGQGCLTLVDISQKHLDSNKNPETKKICADLLEMDLGKKFDLILMRSSLDYFPTKTLQVEVLKKIKKHLKPDGLFINQPAYIGDLADCERISTAYNTVDKIGDRLFQSSDIAELYREAGFEEPKKIGEGGVLHISEKEHIERYGVSREDIKKIQGCLKKCNLYCGVTESGYVMNFDFPIFLSK
ncbi:class I SAM-dependent methyltransferase [Candidatus Campbellbacteria bacterium]|nr:MAG: class I SAM-dependent methyltransferase [Candidatus Campbellbacteria bacterium]